MSAPAVGVYRYASCANGSPALDLAVGAGANANERTVRWTTPFGTVTGRNSYGAAVTQASAVVRLNGTAHPTVPQIAASHFRESVAPV